MAILVALAFAFVYGQFRADRNRNALDVGAASDMPAPRDPALPGAGIVARTPGSDIGREPQSAHPGSVNETALARVLELATRLDAASVEHVTGIIDGLTQLTRELQADPSAYGALLLIAENSQRPQTARVIALLLLGLLDRQRFVTTFQQLALEEAPPAPVVIAALDAVTIGPIGRDTPALRTSQIWREYWTQLSLSRSCEFPFDTHGSRGAPGAGQSFIATATTEMRVPISDAGSVQAAARLAQSAGEAAWAYLFQFAIGTSRPAANLAETVLRSQHPGGTARSTAMSYLVRADEGRAAVVLREFLDSTADANDVKIAVGWLARVIDDEAFATLVVRRVAAAAAQPGVRQALAPALAASDTAEAIDYVEALARAEREPDVLRALVSGLGATGPSRFTSRRAAIARGLLSHAAPAVRIAAIQKLAQLRSAGALPEIRRLAESDQDPMVRAVASSAALRLSR